jgi:hypothetical protein
MYSYVLAFVSLHDCLWLYSKMKLHFSYFFPTGCTVQRAYEAGSYCDSHHCSTVPMARSFRLRSRAVLWHWSPLCNGGRSCILTNSFSVVKGPAADATDAPQPGGLLCNPMRKRKMIIICCPFPSNGAPVEWNWQGKTEVLGEKPVWTDPRSNPGLRGGRPAANRLSHGTARPYALLYYANTASLKCIF